MSYAERIRDGEVQPWVGEGASGCRRSAQIAREEADTLADHEVSYRASLEAQAQAWEARAAELEAAA